MFLRTETFNTVQKQFIQPGLLFGFCLLNVILYFICAFLILQQLSLSSLRVLPSSQKYTHYTLTSEGGLVCCNLLYRDRGRQWRMEMRFSALLPPLFPLSLCTRRPLVHSVLPMKSKAAHRANQIVSIICLHVQATPLLLCLMQDGGDPRMPPKGRNRPLQRPV